MQRILDIVIPSFNRPAKLFALLESGLKLGMEQVCFVVIDDGSHLSEEIPGVGRLDTQRVCEHFKDPRIIYIRNAENMGLARSWVNYYTDHAQATYTMSVVDKDRFVDKGPILGAIAKMERDASLSMVCIPILQQDPSDEDLLFGFTYEKMSGREFISRFVRDENLQHVGGYAIKRVAAIRAAGLPRNMELAQYGLSDMFGIDIDLVLMLAATGNVDFEHAPHVKRFPMGGATEGYPLSFAYTYYQYAKRTVNDLERKQMISKEDATCYLGWWHLLILRGLVAVYEQIDTVIERGCSRIGRHLKLPVHLYLLLEMKRYGVELTGERRELFLKSLKLAYPKTVHAMRQVRPYTTWGLRLPRRIVGKVLRTIRKVMPA